jgi:D-alanine transaminase/branched-chain amino acid aminotransferase
MILGDSAILNGKVIDSSNTVVNIQSRSVQYSFSVYESLRVLSGKPIFLRDHLQRLFQSAKGIKLLHNYSADEITEWIYLLVHADHIEDCTLRILIVGGEIPLCFITAAPLLTYDFKDYIHGVAVSSYKGERLFPTLKTSNLLMSHIALEEAKAHGCFEAVLVDRDGFIREGTRSNFFGFKTVGTLYTAPDNIVLSGVTRTRAVKAAQDMGIEVVYEAPKMCEILNGEYDEIFLSSTSMAAMPIKSLDDMCFSCNHDRTYAIHERIREMEKGDRI